MEENKKYPTSEEEIDLYELWEILLKRKKLIFSFFTIGLVLATVVSFLMKPVYRSEASVIPVSSQPTSGIAELAGQFLGIQIKGENTSSKIMAVLKSRTLRERVVKKLNLVEILAKEVPKGRDPLSVAVSSLEEIITVSSDRKTGLITIGVEYTDKELAKLIATAVLEELKQILKEKALTVAKANRLFLESQLKETEEDLRKALEEFALFQKKEKILVPQEQIKGALELYTELLSRRISLQMELRKLENVLSPDSPRLTYLKNQIKEVEKQLASIERSTGGFSPIPSLEATPEKMARHTEIFLKVKGLQAKYETLLKLYEQAKLEEQRDFIHVEIIDPPSDPDIPVKPKKKLIIAVAGISSLFGGVFLALFTEWLSEARRRRSQK